MWSRAGLPLSDVIAPPIVGAANSRRLGLYSCPDALYIRAHVEGDKSSVASSGPVAKVSWGNSGRVEAVSSWTPSDGAERIVVHGIAGVLKGFHDAYLLIITEASLAAEVIDATRPILSTTDLLALPLRYQPDLLATHANTLSNLYSRSPSVTSLAADPADGFADLSLEDSIGSLDQLPQTPEADDMVDPLSTVRRRTKKPFWLRRPVLFTRKQKSADKPVTTSESAEKHEDGITSSEAVNIVRNVDLEDDDPNTAPEREDLDQKIVRECLREMRGLFFSPFFDITHTLQWKHAKRKADAADASHAEPFGNLPLWKRADKRFWWNRHLMAPFVEAGLHPFVTVLQQGFAQQTTFSLPVSPDESDTAFVVLDLVLISRRSIERPGLRYQRRGINSQGSVANFVETEFIAKAVRGGVEQVASFVQTRGSIPVFWSQSPWSLKPPPVLERNHDDSLKALKKHFEKQVALYDKVVIVNLAEQHGKEAVVVDEYRKGVTEQQDALPAVKYTEFDFHAATKGMKYENLKLLTEQLHDDLEEMSYFWSSEKGLLSEQKGVIRTNCIDCLDRTNVVQSAIARWVLNQHLVHLGITSQQQQGMHDALDMNFNELWADNGDAISRQYAGTSALKGDFTRTGKRNWRGAVNDASNSLARLLQSTVADFFKQAVIDYVLGQNLNAFAEFQERLDLSDPGDLLRLQQIRQVAISTSASQVLQEGETWIAGWALLSPSDANTVRSAKLEEKVLLLSQQALYVVSYEYNLQKVSSFLKIPLNSITRIEKGTYILSTIDPTGRDPKENFGFVVRYKGDASTEKVKTYSMLVRSSSSASVPVRSPANANVPLSSPVAASTASEDEEHFVVFKALRKDLVRLAGEGESRIIDSQARPQSGRKVVEDIVERIADEMAEAKHEVAVVDKDIVTLAQAEAATSFADKLSHSLKALIWM